jgi:hypothetical protein
MFGVVRAVFCSLLLSLACGCSRNSGFTSSLIAPVSTTEISPASPIPAPKPTVAPDHVAFDPSLFAETDEDRRNLASARRKHPEPMRRRIYFEYQQQFVDARDKARRSYPDPSDFSTVLTMAEEYRNVSELRLLKRYGLTQDELLAIDSEQMPKDPSYIASQRKLRITGEESSLGGP